MSFDFDGTGFVIKGQVSEDDSDSPYVYDAQVYIDGKLTETITLPASFTTRRIDIAWKYKLPKARHSVKVKFLNMPEKSNMRIYEALIYSDKPVDGIKVHTEQQIK